MTASSGAAPGSRRNALHVDIRQLFASSFQLVASVDVDLPGGTLLVLFGPSGAGKTTILREIAGLERPDNGVIRFGAEVWCDTAGSIWQPPQARRIGLVFQEPTLFPHLTVQDNIRYGVRHVSDTGPTPTAAPRTLADIETMLGLSDLDKRYPRELSGGEAQRVALARALAPRPQLLLLDEPFASLDAPTRLRLRRDLRALLQTTQTPAVLVTHDRNEALAMGDVIAV
ncbi:MAG: ATP-binding cassette domain-containing protein, partial [Acidobacteria bacterium]|nr:ATP-binding cassette domain-containing protein [Acidobacteriota bacterium]